MHGPDANGSTGLARIAAGGIAWTTAQTWLVRLTGFVTVVILARLLSPEDFGVVAIAMALPPLLQLIADMGLSTYILQAANPTARTYSTFFWYSAGMGVVLSVVLLVTAPAIGALLATPEVVPISAALAPLAMFVILSAVPVTMLRRQMRFRVIAVQGVIAGIISQIVAVALALSGAGAWALIWQALTFQFIVLVLAWVTSRFTPRFTFSRSEFVGMTRFGVKVVSTQIVEAATIWVINAIIVGVLGTAALGYLNIAQRLILLAQELTTNALAGIFTVLFARIQEDLERLRAAFLRALSLTYAAVMLPLVFLIVGASHIIPFVFGDQWAPSIVPAQFLAAACVFACLAGVDYSLFIARGKPGRWFFYAVTVDLVVIGVTLIVAAHGLVVFAIGYAGVAVLATIVRWIMLGAELRTPWWRIAEPLGRTLLPSVGAAAVGVAVGVFVAAWSALPALALIGVAMTAVYLPLLRWQSRAAWVELTGMLGSGLRRIRRR
jgi:O-antigen/teichoic acid export membrane protein